MFSPLFLALECFFLTLILHFLIEQAKKLNIYLSISSQKRLIYLSCFIAITFFSYMLTSNYTFFESIYFLLLLSSLQYSYFHFFNMSQTARRINMLIRIIENKENFFKDEYNSKKIVENRIERLIALNQIEYKNSFLCLKSNFFYNIGATLRFFGKILTGKARQN